MNFTSKSLLALVLAAAIAAAACSAQWISVALQDLPVLTQMALNIATLVSAMETGKQATPADIAVIQNISMQVSRGLNMLQSLYTDYKANRFTPTTRPIPMRPRCKRFKPSSPVWTRICPRCWNPRTSRIQFWQRVSPRRRT